MKKILVTGAFGLVGSDLVLELNKRVGANQVILLSHKTVRDNPNIVEKGDVRNKAEIEAIIKKHNIEQIYHLAGLLSAGGEKDPPMAWDININGLRNILDLSVQYKCQVFWPSSIAVFGPTTPKNNTPQHTSLEPTTIYGVTKLTGELLCQYYFIKYSLDVRSLRYPGLIGYNAPPGDGTTEYSVHIFYEAVKKHSYVCFLKKDTVLPMMFIDDAISGTLDLMAAAADKLTVRTSYNFAAISFAPQDLAAEIQKLMPDFTCQYQPDSRQQIADSWPRSIDDFPTRQDWSWQPEYNLTQMTKIMLKKIKEKIENSKKG